ncbi:hypothetical protein ACP4OV_011899 [Aristida adscensionis]
MVAPGGCAATHTTVHVAGDTVRTTVTARGDVVRRWVRVTRGRLRRSAGGEEARVVVGIGVQWTSPSGALPAGVEPRPCTLQLCAAGGRCLVFQLSRAGPAVPALLRRFLADGGVTFAGYNVAADCRKLRAHHGLEVASAMELRRASGMGDASMEEMAAALLGVRAGGAAKPGKTARDDWGAAKLSKKQVRYAVVDAYLSYRLGAHLIVHGAAGGGNVGTNHVVVA